ncbi:MAG: hypothetical protein CMF04_00875 [Hyphomonas sp.]|nr:hypothetical protein [Hyphomonas sp.]
MVLVRELLRILFFSPYVWLWGCVVAVLFVLPMGDWQLTDLERQGVEETRQLERQLDQSTHLDIAFELGAAHAYAAGCELSVRSDTLTTVLARSGLKLEDVGEGGRHRSSWLAGVNRVLSILSVDGGWAGNRDATCSLAIAGYGGGGIIIPSLISDFR